MNKLAFLSSQADFAQTALDRLEALYPPASVEEASILVVLGGDGFMLHVLRKFLGQNKAIYGMNLGTVGFLMNHYEEAHLMERVALAQPSLVHPLRMKIETIDGEMGDALAINEASLFRNSSQLAKMRILVDEKERLAELSADGILLSTPVGSTAYNLSVNGPILPLNAPLLALTPISAFRPRRWRGALLPDQAHVTIHVLEPHRRPVSAVADHSEWRNVKRVDIMMEHHIGVTLLHDPGHSLEERILREQFGT